MFNIYSRMSGAAESDQAVTPNCLPPVSTSVPTADNNAPPPVCSCCSGFCNNYRNTVYLRYNAPGFPFNCGWHAFYENFLVLIFVKRKINNDFKFQSLKELLESVDEFEENELTHLRNLADQLKLKDHLLDVKSFSAQTNASFIFWQDTYSLYSNIVISK